MSVNHPGGESEALRERHCRAGLRARNVAIRFSGGSGGVFWLCPNCLPFLSLLSAERIGRVFSKQGQLYGQGTIYSTAIMAWSFLDPMLREEQAAAYPLAMAQRVVHQTEAGGAVTNFGHGPQLSRARDSLLLGAVLVRIGSRHQRQRPATNVRGVVVKLEPKHLQTAEGGTRTHTRGEPNWILNPARLPVPPLRPLKAGGIMG